MVLVFVQTCAELSCIGIGATRTRKHVRRANFFERVSGVGL